MHTSSKIIIHDKKDKSTDRTLFFMGCSIFAYTILRAYFLSFTWDESFSYLEFVKANFITFKEHRVSDANNHLLNTWLMEITSRVFGVSEFTLRLPNVFAHLLFLIYSGKLVRNLSSKVLILGAFLILNLNPFVLDFFSIARGYGLSLGFMMASLYYAYKYIEVNKSILSGFLSVLFASISILANLSMLNYLLIISEYLFVVSILIICNNGLSNILKGKISLILKSLIILIPLSILIFIIPLILKLKEVGAFFFGGYTGFWQDTVISLINESLYEHPFIPIMTYFLQGLVVLVIIVSFLLIIYKLSRKETFWKDSFLMLLFIVVLLSFLANYFQHQWFGLLYLKERTALFYYPLFSLLMIFLLDRIYQGKSIVANGICITLSIFFIINFASNANLHYVVQWKQECDLKDMINDVNDFSKKLSGVKEPIYILGSQIFEKDFYFYNDLKPLDQIRLITFPNPNIPMYNYYYIVEQDLSKYPYPNYKIIKEYPISNTFLLSNNQNLKQKMICFYNLDFEKIDSTYRFHSITKETSYRGLHSSKTDSIINFSDGFNYIIDDSLVNNKRALVFLKAMVKSQVLQPDANIVVSFENEAGSYCYQSLNIKNFISAINKWTHIFFKAFVPKEINKGDIVKCYLWNLSKSIIYIDDMELKITAYEKQ
jgi:hypothetical protein